MKIHKQLQQLDFKFALGIKNSKKPCEKKFNTVNCYHFFDEKLINHKGNHIVIAGYGNLIVLDFDSKQYYDEIKFQLPLTFTVLSAKKRLPHLYYILKGEMFKKIAILNKEGKTQCDIMGDNGWVVGPGSIINRTYYEPINDRNIAEITLKQLSEAFGDNFQPQKKREYTGSIEECPEMIENTIKELVKLGIKRTNKTQFKCPFHPSVNGKCLTVFGEGCLYCFHCLMYHPTIESFVKEFNNFKLQKEALQC